MNEQFIADEIARQLERFVGPAREAINRLLVVPERRTRAWPYAAGVEYDCWLVAADRKGQWYFVFCSEGFGPEYPWGVLRASDESLGNDSQWHVSLYDAFLNSPLWDGPMPEGYQVP